MLVQGEPVTQDAQEHLSACGECFHAYWGAVELLTEWFGSAKAEVPSDLAKLGKAHTGPEIQRRSRRTERRWFRLALPAAAGVVVSLGALWLASKPDSYSYQASYAPSVQAVVDRASAHGLVLVGGEGAADRGESERGTGLSDVGNTLEEITRNYRETRDVELGLASVSGYLASDQLLNAITLVEKVRRDHPDDPRVQMLEALAAYRNQDFENADASFGRLLDEHPNYLTPRLNRAIILLKEGRRRAEAIDLLKGVARSAKETPLGRRANRELQDAWPKGL